MRVRRRGGSTPPPGQAARCPGRGFLALASQGRPARIAGLLGHIPGAFPAGFRGPFPRHVRYTPMVSQEYADYLASPAWKEKARFVKGAWKERCYICKWDWR